MLFHRSTPESDATPPRAGASILPFKRPARADDADAVANVILAMEGGPAAPIIMAAKGLDGVHYVGVSVAAQAHRLTPSEACLAADCLMCDPSVLGFADIAQRLRDAAYAASRAYLRSGRG